MKVTQLRQVLLRRTEVYSSAGHLRASALYRAERGEGKLRLGRMCRVCGIGGICRLNMAYLILTNSKNNISIFRFPSLVMRWLKGRESGDSRNVGLMGTKYVGREKRGRKSNAIS